MIGCASLPGADPEVHTGAIRALAGSGGDPAWRVAPLPGRAGAPGESVEPPLDARALICVLPPLVKGYLRLGGFVGDGAVIDPQFNTTDVFIIVKTEIITEKYIRHYERGMNEQDD